MDSDKDTVRSPTGIGPEWAGAAGAASAAPFVAASR